MREPVDNFTTTSAGSKYFPSWQSIFCCPQSINVTNINLHLVQTLKYIILIYYGPVPWPYIHAHPWPELWCFESNNLIPFTMRWVIMWNGSHWTLHLVMMILLAYSVYYLIANNSHVTDICCWGQQEYTPSP